MCSAVNNLCIVFVSCLAVGVCVPRLCVSVCNGLGVAFFGDDDGDRRILNEK